MNNDAKRVYQFGGFRLDASDQLLSLRGQPVPLTPKVFDTLLLLIEGHGRLVGKDEFMERLWPGTFVGEDALSQNISVLRKVLGEAGGAREYIATVPKRGYRFVAELRDVTEESAQPENGKEAQPPPVVAGGERAGRERAAASQPREQRAPRVGWRRPSAVLLTLLLALLGLGYLGWRRFHPAAAAHAGKVMLVVLPFQNLSGDPGQDYVSDGLTEEMITQLGRMRPEGLGVIARTSAMTYKMAQKSTQQIGRELGVDYVLEGSLRRSGDRVRISAQLIQVKDQTHLWAQNYDRDLRDILVVQDQVARAIADQVQIQLAPPRASSLAGARPVNAQAYEAYLRGRYFWNKRTAEGYLKAIENFNQAIQKDPAYALAYAGLADAYILLGGYGIRSQHETIPLARAAARKALELEPMLAEPHGSLGLIAANYDWHWVEAEREYRQAIALNPNYATAHHWYGEGCLVQQGRFDEAIAELKRAQELDPLSSIIQTDLGVTYLFARQTDQAIEQFRRVLEMDPNFILAHQWLAEGYRYKGMLVEAKREIEEAGRLGDGLSALAQLGTLYATSGEKIQARRVLAELKRQNAQGRVPPEVFVDIYIALGDKDQAFAWLEKAYAERSTGLTSLKVSPTYDPLRSDPRFADLMRRVGLSP